MLTQLERVSIMGAAALFLMLFFTGGDPQYASALFASGIVLVVLGVVVVRSRKVEFSRGVALAAPLVLAAIISAISASRFMIGFGAPLRWGSLLSLILFVLYVIAGTYMSRPLVRMFTCGLLVAAAILSVYTGMIALHAVPVFPVAPSFQDVSVVLCFAACLAANCFDSSRARLLQIVFGVLGIMAMLGFLLVLNPNVAFAGAISLLIVLVLERAQSRLLNWKELPPMTALLAVLLLVLACTSLTTPSWGLTNVDYPSLGQTATIVGLEYSSSARSLVFGSGPDSYAGVWNTYRPAAFNATEWWNTTPAMASSDLALLAIEYGVLGLLAFAFIPIAIIIEIVRPEPPLLERDSLLLAIFPLIAAACMPIGTPLLFISGGALGYSAMRAFGSHQRSLNTILTSGIALALFVASFVPMYVGGRALYAAVQYQRAIVIGTTDLKTSSALLSSAADAWPSPRYLADAGAAQISNALSEVQSGQGQQSPDPVLVRTEVSTGDSEVNHSIAYDPKNADLWIARATLYLSLRSIQYPDAVKDADDALAQAQELAPTRPDVYFDRAVIAKLNGDLSAASGYLRTALRLKPDYADAEQLLHTLAE